MLTGTLKDRYRIVRHLGSGGFGQTYLAEDTHLPTTPLCVVKLLSPPHCEPYQLEIAKRLFDKEAETLYRLGKHDRIPQLLAHFAENQEFYLVQEYVPGHHLGQEINQRDRLTPEAVLQILEDILEILVFVHQNHVIHRDIKPHNLIRRESDQRIVLIDFGAVKQVSALQTGTSGNTYTSIVIGTPGYMPNEQLGGKPRFSSDLYALGMVCIQALTARAPDTIPEDPHTAELAWHEYLPPAYLSHPIVRILDKMVRLDFRQRFQSASEVLAAIARIDQSVAVTLVSSPPKDRFQPQQVRDRQPQSQNNFPLWLGVLASLIFVPIVLAIATFNYLRSASPPSEPNNNTIPKAKNNSDQPPISMPTPVATPTKPVVATPIPQITASPKTPVATPIPQVTAPPKTPVATPTKPVIVPHPRVSELPPADVLPPAVRDNMYLRQANKLVRQGKPQEALAVLEKALALQPHNPHVWLLKAVTLRNMGRTGEAKQACQQAKLNATDEFLKRRIWRECGIVN